jgi:predicted CXXCH cytochrome family protein
MDAFQSIDYRLDVKDGRCVLTADDGAGKQTAPADYAFGSGGIGQTYVGYVKGEPIELRLTYYERQKRWHFTPGEQVGSIVNTPVGEKLNQKEEEACFRCHSTALVSTAGRLDLERSVLGVSCEACHGPGRAHVAAVRSGDPDVRMVRLRELRDRVSLDLCGQCHRGPDGVNMASPGMSDQLPRLQGVALSRSRCFKKGGLSCLSCHNPHADVRDTSRAEYNRICSSCHDSRKTEQIACRTAPQGDCVSCHMPAQEVGMPTSPRFHNHWIKVWAERAGETRPEQPIWVAPPG